MRLRGRKATKSGENGARRWPRAGEHKMTTEKRGLTLLVVRTCVFFFFQSTIVRRVTSSETKNGECKTNNKKKDHPPPRSPTNSPPPPQHPDADIPQQHQGSTYRLHGTRNKRQAQSHQQQRKPTSITPSLRQSYPPINRWRRRRDPYPVDTCDT